MRIMLPSACWWCKASGSARHLWFVREHKPHLRWRGQFWTFRDSLDEHAKKVDIALVDVEQFASLANAAVTFLPGTRQILVSTFISFVKGKHLLNVHFGADEFLC